MWCNIDLTIPCPCDVPEAHLCILWYFVTCVTFKAAAEDCLNNAPCTDYVCEAVDSDSNAQAGDGGMHSLPGPMLPLAMSPQVQCCKAVSV